MEAYKILLGAQKYDPAIPEQLFSSLLTRKPEVEEFRINATAPISFKIELWLVYRLYPDLLLISGIRRRDEYMIELIEIRDEIRDEIKDLKTQYQGMVSLDQYQQWHQEGNYKLMSSHRPDVLPPLLDAITVICLSKAGYILSFDEIKRIPKRELIYVFREVGTSKEIWEYIALLGIPLDILIGSVPPQYAYLINLIHHYSVHLELLNFYHWNLTKDSFYQSLIPADVALHFSIQHEEPRPSKLEAHVNNPLFTIPILGYIASRKSPYRPESGNTNWEFPRAGCSNFESGRSDPKNGRSDPKNGRSDPKNGRSDPRNGRERFEIPRSKIPTSFPPSRKESAIDFFNLKEPIDCGDIKRAYRSRALKEHPDKGGTEAGFIRTRKNYETLVDEFDC